MSVNQAASLPASVAILACISYTCLYVGVLYLSPLTRPRPGLDRNHPLVIRTRIRAATFVTLLCVFLTSVAIFLTMSKGWWETLEFMGVAHVTPGTVRDAVRALGLTAVLFAGPVLVRLAMDGVACVDGIANGRLNLIGWRNYVVAPLTEEIVFRACMVPLLLAAGVSPTSTVFLAPLVFGIAHFHHAYEFLLNYPDRLGMAVVSSLAQFTYTTPFGWFAVFVFLRTGSVWPAVAVHTFCNYMGAPSLSVGGPKWLSYVYYALLLGGSWGFYKLLWPLTESSNAFVQFG